MLESDNPITVEKQRIRKLDNEMVVSEYLDALTTPELYQIAYEYLMDQEEFEELREQLIEWV